MKTFLIVCTILFWVLLVAVVIGYRIYRKRKKLPKIVARWYSGRKLYKSVQKLRVEARNKNIREETLTEVGTGVFVRLTRIGVFAILAALIPILLIGVQVVLLSQQNKKMDEQKEQIKVQNDRINLQNNLIEADRRGSLILLMSNVLDQMNDEIQVQREKDQAHYDSVGYSLSNPLIGRIAAFSQGFIPYKYLENDTLTAKSVSPERGQLLLALVKSNLDSVTYRKLYEATQFSYAYLAGADLKKSFLSHAKLNSADLRGADFSNADLRGADFSNANLSGAFLKNADLRNVQLDNANLSYADISGADLRRTNLGEVDFSKTDLRGAFFSVANLNKAKFQDADLRGAYLRYANLYRADLYGANLTDSDLHGAYLRNANLDEVFLRFADLKGVNFTEANLHLADLRYPYRDRLGVIVDIGSTRNWIYEQLMEAFTLHKCQNLDSIIQVWLIDEMPCLFTEEGCEENKPERIDLFE